MLCAALVVKSVTQHQYLLKDCVQTSCTNCMHNIVYKTLSYDLIYGVKESVCLGKGDGVKY